MNQYSLKQFISIFIIIKMDPFTNIIEIISRIYITIRYSSKQKPLDE